MLKLASIICLAALGANAATIRFTALPPNHEYGTYNGFASATVDGQENQGLICDDFDHTTTIPSGAMTFLVSTLTGSHPLQYARFVNLSDWTGSILKYEEAAFLLDGLTKAEPTSTKAADYQSAIWHLFTPHANLTSGGATLLSQAAASARTGGADLNDEFYSRLRIYTPTAQYASNQEFLQWLPEVEDPGGPSPVPEPGTWWMMLAGAGLVAMSCCSKRMIRQRVRR